MIIDSGQVTKNIDETCDVVVVGSGAGGSVMAKELAERGLSVILIEEGGYHTVSSFNNTDTINSLVNLYRNAGGTFLAGKPNVMYAEGCCVGGSTTINGGMCWRTPDKILKRWQWEFGLTDLTPKKMEPFHHRVEEIISVKPVLQESMNNDSMILKRGADKLGYQTRANLRNHNTCVGANQCITGCPTGGKQPPLVTYIPAFLKAGGKLITHCRVKKIRLKNRRATGVKGVMIDPVTKAVRAKVKIRSKITIVCCGAVQTPALLMRSGIRSASGALGNNLFIHPNTKVLGVFDEPIYGWKGVNQAYQITEFIDEGIIMGVNFIPPGIFALAFPFYGGGFLNTMKEIFNHSVCGAALIEDTSRGRVINLPFDQVVTTYQLNARDFELAKRATALLAEIYFAAGAKRVYLPFRNLHEINSIDEVRKIYTTQLKPIDLELMSVHIMGTCRMGINSQQSVVNPSGELHDVKGLFVADASLFPSSIGVNPQQTIMALATRSAFLISENISRYMI